MTWLGLLLLLTAMAASFLFSGMEAGVMALNRLRIRLLKRQGNRRAQQLYDWLEQPEPFLWTILIGNTLATLTAAGLLVVLLMQQLAKLDLPERAAFWLFWLVYALALFFVLYLLCDLLPKVMFRLFPTRLCLWFAPFFNVAWRLLSPAVALVSRLATGLVRWSGQKQFTGRLFSNRGELRRFVEESALNLSTEERAMINRVLDLQNRTVRQLARPLAEVACVDAQTPVREALALCRERQVSRLPVWQGEGAARRIAGILSLRATLYREDLNPDLPAQHYLRPALYLDEDLRLETALARLQRAGERVAIVLDRNRRETGLVSLQDILRVVFGDVQL